MHFRECLKQLRRGSLTVPCLLGLEPTLMTAAARADGCCSVSIRWWGPREQ